MPNLGDEQFKSYLKRFRPLAPDALPANKIGRIQRRRNLSYIWAVSGAVALVTLGLISLRTTGHQGGGEPKPPDQIQVVQPGPGLTIRGANALLATAPSYKAALNGLAFHPPSSDVPNDKQSALAVLAKEKIKL